MDSRSRRLTATFLASSTTPRTTRRRLEELADGGDCSELIYHEIKDAMVVRNTEAAVSLANLLPMDYKNAERYLQQCRMYDRLCEQGLVKREGTSQLRDRLCIILGEGETNQDVARYSDSLLRRGFNAAAIDTCTIHGMEEAMAA